MQTKTKGVEGIITEVTGLLAELENLQCLLTVMFTDIVGSTSYFERHGDVMGMILLEKVESILRPQVLNHEGKVVKTIGDSIMAYFENPVRAVRCGIEMQRALEKHNRQAKDMEPVKIRVAINLGVAILRDNDVYGDVVNVCSRIERKAEAGQVCVSPSVVEAVQNEPDLLCKLIGSVAFRGKAQKMDLYEVECQTGASRKKLSAVNLSSNQIALAAGSSAQAPQELRTMIAQVASGEATVTSLASLQQDFDLVEVLPGQKLGERFPVNSPCTVVGTEKADVILSGPFLAPQHATFTPLGGALYVDDLSDGQGVFVRVRKSQRLVDGVLLALGRLRFRFQLTGKPGGACQAKLVRIFDGGKTENYPLQKGETTIGRKQCTYTFPEDRYLSRLHARLRFYGTQCFLEDLGSSNGTFIAIHERYCLSEEDDVLIGEKTLRVVVRAAG